MQPGGPVGIEPTTRGLKSRPGRDGRCRMMPSMQVRTALGAAKTGRSPPVPPNARPHRAHTAACRTLSAGACMAGTALKSLAKISGPYSLQRTTRPTAASTEPSQGWASQAVRGLTRGSPPRRNVRTMEREGPVSRSRESLGIEQQVYAVIEFCNTPEALFGKIDSGKYDWLGVKGAGRRRTFVVGSPRRAARSLGIATVKHVGAEDGHHRVAVRVPHHKVKSWAESWWPTAAEARADFERQTAALLEGEGSAIYAVRLYQNGDLTDEKIVVRVLPNVL